MPLIKRFEELYIWQESMTIVSEIYTLTQSENLAKDYGLKDQITRAAVSIPSNIAEGFEFLNKTQFCRYLRYAKASCGELRTQLYILIRIGYICAEKGEMLLELTLRLSRKINRLIIRLKSN